MDKKEIVLSFIERVCNRGQLEEFEKHLSADFVDYSLPKGFGNDLQATLGANLIQKTKRQLRGDSHDCRI